MQKQNVNYHREMLKEIKHLESQNVRPTLLIHSCCAPCSTVALERLVAYFDVTVYFYNPNIQPKHEYEKRLEAQKTFIDLFNERTNSNVGLIAARYKPREFFDKVKGMEDEPEGGVRCHSCFELRIEDVAKVAVAHHFDYFSTAISLGPKKDSQVLNEIGIEIEAQYGVKFLRADFKKDNGYKRSIEMSSEYDIYRQCYCGCVFANQALRSHLKNRLEPMNSEV